MIGYDLRFFVPFSLIIFLIGWKEYKKNNKSKWYWLTFFFSITYMNCAIDKLFFPIFYDNPKKDYLLSNYVNCDFLFGNLEMMHIIYNIVVTVPLAFAICFIIGKNRLKIISSIIIVSCPCIELIQLLIIATFKTGNIWFDIKDMILNVLGGIIGVFLLYIIKKNLPRFTDRSFIGYIINVFKE
ncbi:MAG: VanZ family protein [Lachnospiraceae bacterium]|nr:VanZ family protein [Lachnospiraceae bacterium]